MADRIKGIVVEIGGDTTGLSKALSGVNREISSTQNQLRDVERLLKLDPTNTQLLEQKQRLLASAISQTKEKLDTLKTAEKQVQEQFERGEVSREQYEALQREIAATAQELERFEQKAKDGTSALEKMGSAAQTVSDKAGGVQKAFAPVTAAVGGLTTAAVATVPATEELRSDLSKLDQAARDNAVGAETARKAWEAFAVASDETDAAVEATANLLQAGFTESNLQKAVEGLTGAYLRFPDTLKIESLADSLQETLATGEATGQFAELLDRLGIGAEQFGEKLAACTDEAERQELVLETLSEAGLDATYQGWAENNRQLVENKEATLELQQATAELAEKILPAVTRVVEAGAALLEWFLSLDPAVQNAVAAITVLLGVISPVAGIVGAIASGVTLFTGTILPALTAALTAFAGGPMVLIAAAIAAVVAGILLFQDEIYAVLEGVWTWLEGSFLPFWQNLFSAMGNTVSAFSTRLQTAVESVRTFLLELLTWLASTFTQGWQTVWQSVVDLFQSIFESLVEIAKAPLNGILRLINGVIDGLNTMIRGLNQIQIDIPDWVPGLGGNSFGINIPAIPSLPYLAKGGIVTQGSAIVGEAGPELLTVAGGRAIVQPLTGAAAGTTVYQTNNFNGTYKPRDGEAAVRDLNRRLGWVY